MYRFLTGYASGYLQGHHSDIIMYRLMNYGAADVCPRCNVLEGEGEKNHWDPNLLLYCFGLGIFWFSNYDWSNPTKIRYPIPYNRPSNILGCWLDFGEVPKIEKWLICKVESWLVAPTPSLDLIRECCTLDERMLIFKACECLEVA